MSQKAWYRTTLYLKNRSSTILTCVGAIGVVVTSIMAVKATPKAMKLLEMAKDEKGEDLTKFEMVRVAGPAYIPTIIMGVSTISCIFGANVLSKSQQASITSAYALIDNAYKEYKNKVKELLGDESDSQIRKEVVKDKYDKDPLPISEEKQLFYEEYYGKCFERTKEEVLSAEYHFNRNFALRGYANLNEFYEFLGLEKTEFGEALGWSFDAGAEFYGYSWVDFEHQLVTMDDGLECFIITMPFLPTADYGGF